MVRWRNAAFALLGAFLWAPSSARAQAAEPSLPGTPPPPACAAPPNLGRLDSALARTAERIASGGPLTVVAVGSSSTAGAGASAPSRAYPSRLEAELKLRFPGVSVTVLNRGVNGEDAAKMLARFDEDVLAEHPDLVIWQVGTNAVLLDEKLAQEAPLLREGIARLKAAGADVVLLDPQYAPKVLAKPDAQAMVDLIAATAAAERVGDFRRFAIMRHWRKAEGIPFEAMLSPDGLHMNDWGYACVAKLLGAAIAEASRPAAALARGPRR